MSQQGADYQRGVPDPLEDLLVAAATQGGTSHLLTVADVALVLQLEASWVYDHARELGAVRLGRGVRSPIRFEPRTVAAGLRALAQGASSEPPALEAPVQAARAKKKKSRGGGPSLLPVRPRQPRLGEAGRGATS
jgi:hypothetical protein